MTSNAAKFVDGNVSRVFAAFFLNLATLAANWLIYARNKHLNARRRQTRA